MGKGGSGPVTIGYHYYLTLHLALCHGPVDYIRKIRAGDTAIVWDEAEDQWVPTDAGSELSLGTGDISYFYLTGPDGDDVYEYGVRLATQGAASWYEVQDTSGQWRKVAPGENPRVSGAIFSDAYVTVNKPNLFGGKLKDGGVVGTFSVLMGDEDQLPNEYLREALDNVEHLPAFRGVVSIIWQNLLYGSNTATPKPWQVQATRIPLRNVTGTFDAVTLTSEHANINGDANPAHIAAEVLTNTLWGLGYSWDDIDIESFAQAAVQLYEEGFGLSTLWQTSSSAEEFLNVIMGHCNGVLYLDPVTGKFTFKLIRGNYNVDELFVVDPSNILDFGELTRTGIGELVNQVTIKWVDRDTGKWRSMTAHNPALREAQGSIVAVTREYPALTSKEAADQVVLRDLALVSQPLANVKLVCNRTAYHLSIGDVIKLNWPDLGIVGMILRVSSVGYGTLENGSIHLECTEDIFGAHLVNYVLPDGTEWVDPTPAPEPSPAQYAFDATYMDVLARAVHERVPIADIDDDMGFNILLAAPAQRNLTEYELWASDDGVEYAKRKNAYFNAHGLLAQPLPPEVESVFTIKDSFTTDWIKKGQFAVCQGEWMYVQDLERHPVTGEITLTCYRGIIDTTPQYLPYESDIWFYDKGHAVDYLAYEIGEVILSKARTRTATHLLPLESAPPAQVTIGARWSRPYPPGNLQINGQRFPTQVTGNAHVTWSHRNRVKQDLFVFRQDEADILPELGTTYTVRVIRADGTIARTVENLTETWFDYSTEDATFDNAGNLFFIGVVAVFEGRASHMPSFAAISRTGAAVHAFPSFGDYVPTGVNVLDDIRIELLSVKGVGTEFSGRDAVFSWSDNRLELFGPGSKYSLAQQENWFHGYKVTISLDGVVRRTEVVLEPTYTYTYDKNVEDGVSRTFTIDVCAIDMDEYASPSATLTVANSPTALTNVTISPRVGFLFLQVTTNDPDHQYTKVFASKTQGFTPDATNLVYHGTDVLINATTPETGTYYIRVLPVDDFGEEGAIFSEEYTQEIFASEIPLATMEQIDLVIADYNTRNNQNTSPVVAPTVPAGSLTSVVRNDSLANLLVRWEYSVTDQEDIDGFVLALYSSILPDPYTITGETETEQGDSVLVYGAMANQRTFTIPGVQADWFHTVAISAYRVTDLGTMYSDIVHFPGVPHQPAEGLAFNGDVTGTLNGVPVDQIAIASVNYNLSNDNNADAIPKPVIADNGTALDYTWNTDGSIDATFEWQWDYDDSTIDGFHVYVRSSTVDNSPYVIGSLPNEEVVFTVPSYRRWIAFLGVPANRYYSVGVRAYRRVNHNVTPSGLIMSPIAQPTHVSEAPWLPSNTVAFAGDLTGTIDGRIFAEHVNIWDYIDGDGRPADNADVTKDQISGSGINILNSRYALIDEQNIPPYVLQKGTVDLNAQANRFGAPAIALTATSRAAARLFLGATQEDYNFVMDPNRKWLFSAYVVSSSPNAGGLITVQGSQGGSARFAFATSATPGGWSRVSGVLDFSADSSSLGIVVLENTAGKGVTINFTGLMMEELIGNLIAPSAFVRPVPSLSVIQTTVADAGNMVQDFYAQNNRNGDPIPAPVIATDGTALDSTFNNDGSANISLEWTWPPAGSELTDADIDGFAVLVYHTEANHGLYYFDTNPKQEGVYLLPPWRRSIIETGPADRFYTVAVVAYRVVDKDINPDGIIRSALAYANGPNERPYQPRTDTIIRGTLTADSDLDGTSVVLLISNAEDGANAYTGTAKYRSVGAPTTVPTPLSLTTVDHDNATRDIILEWDAYVQGDNQADVLMLFYSPGTDMPTYRDSCIVMNVNTEGTATYVFPGVPPTATYRAGIAAARRTESGLEIGQIVPNDASWTIVGEGQSNYTGLVNGQTAAELVQQTELAFDAIKTSDLWVQTILTNGQLDAVEKPGLREEWEFLIEERSKLLAQASAIIADTSLSADYRNNVTAKRDAYSSTLQTIANALNGGVAFTVPTATTSDSDYPLWINNANINVNTVIEDEAGLRTMVVNFYTARAWLYKAIPDAASQAAIDTELFRKPGAPDGVVTLTNLTRTYSAIATVDITLSWSYVPGSIPADEFVIYATDSATPPTETSTVIAVVPASNTTYRIPGVPADKTYSAGVTMRRKAADGVYESEIVTGWAYTPDGTAAITAPISGDATVDGTSLSQIAANAIAVGALSATMDELNTYVANATSDNYIDVAEKREFRIAWEAYRDEYNTLQTLADLHNLDMLWTAYQGAFQEYCNLLNDGYWNISNPPADPYPYHINSTNVLIGTAITAANGITIRETIRDFLIAREDLRAALSQTADWELVDRRPKSLTELNAVDGATLTTAATNADAALEAVALLNTDIALLNDYVSNALRDLHLDPVEKNEFKIAWELYNNEYTTLYPDATAKGLTTLRNSYHTAFINYSVWLNDGNPWNIGDGLPYWIDDTKTHFSSGTDVSAESARIVKELIKTFLNARSDLRIAVSTAVAKDAEIVANDAADTASTTYSTVRDLEDSFQSLANLTVITVATKRANVEPRWNILESEYKTIRGHVTQQRISLLDPTWTALKSARDALYNLLFVQTFPTGGHYLAPLATVLGDGGNSNTWKSGSIFQAAFFQMERAIDNARSLLDLSFEEIPNPVVSSFKLGSLDIQLTTVTFFKEQITNKLQDTYSNLFDRQFFSSVLKLLNSERAKFVVAASSASVSSTAFVSAHNAIETWFYVTTKADGTTVMNSPIPHSDTVVTQVTAGELAHLMTLFDTYQVQRDALVNAISKQTIENTTLIPDIEAAQIDASDALSKISDIYDDNKLTSTERQQIRREWDNILEEHASLQSTATLLSLTTTYNNYESALEALGTRLNGSVGWTLTSGTTPQFIQDAVLNTTTIYTVNGSLIRSTFADFYNKRAALRAAIENLGGQAALDTVNFRSNAAPTGTFSGLDIQPSVVSASGLIDLDLSWTFTPSGIAPDNFAIYCVQGTSGPTTSDTVFAEVPASTTKHKIVGLPADKSYRIAIRSLRYSASSIVWGTMSTAMGYSARSFQIAQSVTEATKNVVSSGTLANRPTGANGDFYYATDNNILYQKISGSWVQSANNYTSSSQLTDGAGWSETANWSQVNSRPTSLIQLNATDGNNLTNALNTANAANSSVNDIIADSKFTPNEKRQIRADWDAIFNERAVLESQATALGVTTEKNTYTSKMNALGNYLDDQGTTGWTYPTSGVPDMISNAQLATTHNISSPSTFRLRIAEFYGARTKLLSKMAEVAATKSDWSNVNGKPTSVATLNATDGNNLSAATTAANDTSAFRTTGAPSNNPTLGSLNASSQTATGLVDITLTWAYTQGTRTADEFVIYYNEGTSSSVATPTTSSAVLCVVNGSSRSFRMFGVPADKFYRFGITARRKAADQVYETSIVTGTTWYRAGVTAQINGTNADTVVTNANNGAIAFSNTATFRTPGNPNNVTSVWVSPSAITGGGLVDITLTWPYTDNASLPVDNFLIYIREGTTNPNNTTPVFAEVVGTARKHIITGVPADKSYRFGVRAIRYSAFGIHATGNIATGAYNAQTFSIPATKTEATKNVVSSGRLASRPTGANGDFYYATDTKILYQKVSGSWITAANAYTNTSELTDGAGLGTKATWLGIVNTDTTLGLSNYDDVIAANTLTPVTLFSNPTSSSTSRTVGGSFNSNGEKVVVLLSYIQVGSNVDLAGKTDWVSVTFRVGRTVIYNNSIMSAMTSANNAVVRPMQYVTIPLEVTSPGTGSVTYSLTVTLDKGDSRSNGLVSSPKILIIGLRR